MRAETAGSRGTVARPRVRPGGSLSALGSRQATGARWPRSPRAWFATLDRAGWRRLLVRVAVVLLGAVALLALGPKVVAVFTAVPKLRGFHPGWYALMVVLEAGSFACVWGLLRITMPGLSWRLAICSHLAGHAVGRLLPGGGALGSACQLRMLTVAGLDAATAGSALTVVSLLTTGLVFALPVFALPAILLGHVPAGLSAAAMYGAIVFTALAVSGVLLAFASWPPRVVGTILDWVLARFGYRVPGGLAAVLVQRRNDIRAALGRRWRVAALAAAGKSGLDCLTLMVALTATGQGPRPVLVLLAYVAATLLSMVPVTPGGLGFVEAGLVGMLVVAGIPPGPAALATLAYRLVAYWLPMPVGVPAWFAFRRWHGDGSSPAVDTGAAAVPTGAQRVE